jgi:hypothetical protein
MSSYALLQVLSGFRYSAATKTLWLAPKVNARPFRTFFSTASAWGTITLEKKRLTVKLTEGELWIERLNVCDEWMAIAPRRPLGVGIGETVFAIR